MRATFSVIEAVGSGWGVLRRHPGAVAVWALVYAAMVVLMIAVMAQLLLPMLQQVADDPENVSVFKNLEWQLRLQMLTAPLNGLTLIVEGVIGAAIVRAVLAGTRPFAWVRLWSQEFLLVVIQLAVVIGLAVLLIPLAMLAAALGFGLWQLEPAAGVVAGLAAGLATLGLWLWLALRLSLVGPASVATRTLAFSEGWRLSRGQLSRLFTTGLLTVLMIVLVQLVLVALIALAVWAGYAAGIRFPTIEVHAEVFDPALLQPYLAPALVAVVVMSFLQALLNLLWQAPWSSAYAQLSAARASSSPLSSGSGSGSSSPTNESDTELMQ